jgi:hypothetical protein
MKLSRLALALTVTALPFSGCTCEEPLARLAPIIAIGDPFDPNASVCAAGLDPDSVDKFRDCAFNFGDVDIGRARVFSFTVRNPSPVRLSITSMTFAEGSDPAFSLDGEVPTAVASEVGNVGEVVSVKFQPQVEGPVSATLVIKSDGENLDDGEDVVIQLTANGLSRCKPKIEVDNGRGEAACNFGDVGVGATAFCDLSINNVGECELLVRDLGFGAESPSSTPAVFGPQSNFVVPTAIAAGTGVSLRLYARPQSTVATTGSLTISSLDPETPTVDVPLSVQGAEAPTCIARVSRVNNTVVAPNAPDLPAIEPLDNVEFSADQSISSRAGGTIQSYEWEILSKPAESSARVASPSARETRMQFSSSAGNVSGLDVAGTYTLGLVVTDNLGAVSTQCTVTVNAVPGEGLHVQLTWDTPGNDIDLHLARSSGGAVNWCDGNEDCSYENCKASVGIFASAPEWDGQNGRGPGDPVLDIDDVCGFGPENITLEDVGDGRYVIGVTYFGEGFNTGPGNNCTPSSAPTTATVKVFIGGALEFEDFAELNIGDPWVPARVDMLNGVAQLTAIGDRTAPGSCLER